MIHKGRSQTVLAHPRFAGPSTVLGPRANQRIARYHAGFLEGLVLQPHLVDTVILSDQRERRVWPQIRIVVVQTRRFFVASLLLRNFVSFL